jgi:putative SOS response-associated peptidase YedK
MAAVRAQLEEQGMEVDEALDDEEVRETYNFAPGYYGAVYRGKEVQKSHGEEDAPEDDSHQELPESTAESEGTQDKNITYKLQKMRWGLIPSWTKRQPDYGSMMRTINCREDSLIDDRGMWTSMKRKKRCVVVCQGFYEWLKKGPGGKERVPHYTKRKDGNLMWFAGLWDCVQYEGLFISSL